MTERIDSARVLEPNAVSDVRPETKFEAILRVLRPVARGMALYSIVVAAFVVCICILFSTNPDLANYRAGAWTTLIGISGTAMGVLFGDNVLPK